MTWPDHTAVARTPTTQNIRVSEVCHMVAAVASGGQPLARRTNHDEGVRDSGKDVEVALEDEREDREGASEKVDKHERERDPEDGAVLVDIVVQCTVLWSLGQHASRHDVGNEKHVPLFFICWVN